MKITESIHVIPYVRANSYLISNPKGWQSLTRECRSERSRPWNAFSTHSLFTTIHSYYTG